MTEHLTESPVAMQSAVNVHNEWDPLEEIIVGHATHAQIPDDLGIQALSQIAADVDVGARDIPRQIIEETEEDLAIFVSELEKLDVKVQRPNPIECRATLKTPFWESGYFFSYCPRDVLMTVGDLVIETPNVLRSRFFEPWAYKELLTEYLKSGSRWISAPRPTLDDKTYNLDDPEGCALNNHEPVFDAANVIRAGRDLFYLVSHSGNDLGHLWLQSTLGPEYRVHACRNMYRAAHIDTTLVFLRPGLVLVNPLRINEDNLPEPLRNWDVMYAPEMEKAAYSDQPPLASDWIGMNLLMINPDLAVVDFNKTTLIRMLERAGINVLPLLLRHGRSLGGGFHCVTLDVRRRGSLETYC